MNAQGNAGHVTISQLAQLPATMTDVAICSNARISRGIVRFLRAVFFGSWALDMWNYAYFNVFTVFCHDFFFPVGTIVIALPLQ